MILADAPAPDERDPEVGLSGRDRRRLVRSWFPGGAHRSGAACRTASPRRSYDVPHESQAVRCGSPSVHRVGRRSPHWHIHPMRFAGTPATRAYAGTSLVTTAPAPTNAYSPRVTPQTI